MNHFHQKVKILNKYLMMNKARRFEIKMTKFKKRLKVLGLLYKEGNFHCYRTSGSPCSCYMCSPYKFKRKIKHKNQQQ
jgi:hypothetical protein